MSEAAADLAGLLDPELKRHRNVELARSLAGPQPEADRDDALVDALADRIAERLLEKLDERRA
jgi:hypothetical protein